MNSKLARLFIALFFALVFSSSVKADEVDKFVRAVMQERQIPGAAIAVVKNGKIVKKQGYGVASVEFGVPVTPDTVFEIGSVTKQMTAAAVMLLVEDGKVRLDDKISVYLPGTPEAWKNVTVRNLLTHTSGIKSYTAIGAGFELTKRLKRDDFIKALAAYPLDFEPGARYSYSNSGYNLLGLIIEAASGKPYWDFMRERIFAPLGMTETFDRDPKYIIKNRATGYELENNQLVGRDYDLTDIFSAGAIVSTVGDLAKWDAAWRNDTLLKKESKQQAWTPFVLNDGKPYPYGFGWSVADFRGHKLISHSGSTAGFSSQIMRFTDDDLSVIVLINQGTGTFAGAIARGVAKIYIPEISLRAMKAQAEADKALSETLANALRERMENKFDARVLTDNLIKSLSTTRAKANNLRLASFGTIKNFTFVGGETADDSKIYRYKAETAKRLFLWRFAVNGEGRITEMTIEDEE
ncbi:MAG TPA: serine hydrolase [Pyrinomonadaceae bacterium]|jgi:CubicO group peptidase (beta-lactamase class C family)